MLIKTLWAANPTWPKSRIEPKYLWNSVIEALVCTKACWLHVQAYGWVLWSSDQFRELWYRSSFGRGPSVSQSFPERGYYGTTRMRNKPLSHLLTDPSYLLLYEAGAWKEISGKKVFSSSSWSNSTHQQLYATRPPGGCREGVGRPSLLNDNMSTSPLQLLCLGCPCVSLELGEACVPTPGGMKPATLQHGSLLMMRKEGSVPASQTEADENRKREKYKTEENN